MQVYSAKLSNIISRYWLPAAVAAAVICMLGATEASALYSSGYIDNNLPHGISSARNWDNRCRAALSDHPGVTFNDTNNNLRKIINHVEIDSNPDTLTGASYKQTSWISARDNPDISSPIVVMEGDTTIPLQINKLDFLCRTMIQPDLYSTCPNNGVSAQDILDASYWVNNNSNARDRPPNPIGGGCMQPARTGTNNHYIAISDNGNPLGYVTSFGGPQNVATNRDENSRYWFANRAIDFIYRSSDSSGFRASDSGVIYLRVRYKEISEYYGSTHRCAAPSASTGSYVAGSFSDWGSCGEQTRTFPINILVRKPPTIGADVTITPTSVALMGDTIRANAELENSGDYDGRVNWERWFWYEQAGGASVYNSGDTLIQHADGNGRLVSAGDSYSFGQWSELDASVGRICTRLVISPADGDTTVNPNSDVDCVAIAKYPTMQVLGGDLRSGGRFPEVGSQCTNMTSDSFASNRIRGHDFGDSSEGSFSAFGVIAAGPIIDFGSNGLGPYSGSLDEDLMFGRVGSSDRGYFYAAERGSFGSGAVPTHCFSDVFNSQFRTAPSTQTIANGGNLSVNAEGNHDNLIVFNGSNSTLEIDGGTVNSNQRRVIYVEQSGDKFADKGNEIVITGDILYEAGPYGSIFQLPEFALVVDGNIDVRVDQGVEQMYGIYATRGNFATCDQYKEANSAATLTASGDCENQLHVYGLVIAEGNVYPYRTAGDSNDPAEIFELIPAIDLANYANSREQSNNVRTVSQRELPPRF